MYYAPMVDNIQVKSENVIIGPGTKELMFLTNIAFNGDILLPFVLNF